MPRRSPEQKQTIRDRFEEVVLQQLMLETAPDFGQLFSQIPNVDSLDVIELVMECEDTFGVEISDQQLEKLDNLEALWGIVQKAWATGDLHKIQRGTTTHDF